MPAGGRRYNSAQRNPYQYYCDRRGEKRKGSTARRGAGGGPDICKRQTGRGRTGAAACEKRIQGRLAGRRIAAQAFLSRSAGRVGQLAGREADVHGNDRFVGWPLHGLDEIVQSERRRRASLFGQITPRISNFLRQI